MVGRTIATIYRALGIDTSLTLPDQDGRPHPIAQHGEPIGAIVG
jgi:hypothetical protein